MTNNWDKFTLLFWKNWLLQKRHPLQTLLEIAVPVLFCALVLLVRGLVVVEEVPHPIEYNSFNPLHLPPKSFGWIDGRYQIYSSFEKVDYESLNDKHGGHRSVLQTVINNIKLRFQDQSLQYEELEETKSTVLRLNNESLGCEYGLWWKVGWSPNTNENLEKIMEYAGKNLRFCPRGFANEQEMLEVFNGQLEIGQNFNLNVSAMKDYLAGIVFDQGLENSTEVPIKPIVKVRFPGETREEWSDVDFLSSWKTKSYFPQFQLPGPREKNQNEGGGPGYYREGFLGLQFAISQSLLNYHLDELHLQKQSYLIYLQRYPYPAYINDPLLPVLKSFIPLIIVLSFVYSCTSTVKTIITEKERQLKESMKMMGLPGWLHWLAWFTQLTILFFISCILIVILMKAPFVSGGYKVLPYSDWSCLLAFFFIYIVCSITFCFALTTFFAKANAGAILAGLLWFLCYFPFAFMQQNYEGFDMTEKTLSCLLVNSAMGHGFQVLLMLEGTGKGLQWSNMWTPPSQDDGFTMGHAMGMLLVDSVIYILITIYVEGVYPGDYGVPLPWYFPVTRSYWCGSKPVTYQDNSSDHKTNLFSESLFEPEPKLMNPGIQIKHLRKVYSNNKVAVSDLNLNMYEGQITVLLGHNGAGKTTTMSMLTGLYTPTSGTALLAGHDIRTDMDGARRALGLCPQHNVLFDELTVREHLTFFGKLKGLSTAEIKQETLKFVGMLELNNKIDSPSGTLSGGMQRKLAVAVALCGNSKVVLLDEPTSGMDPGARRCLWDLLQNEKVNRTILLTTHFMDEADLLGDRIAIMSGGQLKCCGSSFFLKKRYGGAYRLIMVKGPTCNPEQVTNCLREIVPDIDVASNIGSELSYLLEDKYSNSFEKMFAKIEDLHGELGVVSYGVSSSTIEDVFVTAGGDDQIDQEPEITHKPLVKEVGTLHSIYISDQTDTLTVSDGSPSLLSGFRLMMNQISAMFIKYFLSTYRSYVLYIFIILIPILDLAITIVVMRSYNLAADLPPRSLNLNEFPEGISTVERTSNDSLVTNWTNIYQNLMDPIQTVVTLDDNQTTSDFVLEESDKDLAKVLQRYTVGATFNELRAGGVNITGWFNNQPYHGPPIALSYVFNTIFQAFLGPDAGIEFINAPLPFTLETKIKVQQSGATMGFQLAFNVGFCMAFVASFMVILLVHERVTKSKLLQFVSGVNIYVYWLTAYIWNIASLIFPFLAIIITIVAFQEHGFDTAVAIGRIFALLLCYSVAVTPIVFLSTYLFSVPASGFVQMALLNMVTGVLLFIVTAVLETPDLNLLPTADILDWVFTILPTYSLSYAFYELDKNFLILEICEKPITSILRYCRPDCTGEGCLVYEKNYFAFNQPGIGRNLVFFFIDAIFFTLLLLLIEGRVWEMVLYSCKRNKKINLVSVTDSQEDSDVFAERQIIKNVTGEDKRRYNLLLQNVTKYYGKFLAVNQICLGVNKGECFGLLGVNGAGKTSLFKMLTGDEKITFGDGFVDGFSLKYDMKLVYQHIGYCPQFDALIGKLTGRETLKIFCLLRGVRAEDINYISEKLARDLLFLQHIDKKVQEYSGGNKRKLSTALALVGDPPVIYLDEPTTGMDPVAKRHLWNVICDLRNSGKTIILTSHSMEECEALCTRLAIMVNGEFKCLGSTQHLKNKFAQGYTLTVKVRKSHSGIVKPILMHSRSMSGVSVKSNTSVGITEHDVHPVKVFITNSFVDAELKEEYQGLLTYHIPSQSDLTWAKMFGLLESAKQELNIEDYSLGQTSLEQVFLSFTKYQRDESS